MNWSRCIHDETGFIEMWACDQVQYSGRKWPKLYVSFHFDWLIDWLIVTIHFFRNLMTQVKGRFSYEPVISSQQNLQWNGIVVKVMTLFL